LALVLSRTQSVQE